MIYLMAPWLQELWSPLRILQYVSVRAALAAGMAFVVALVLGPPLIRRLKAAGVGENAALSDSDEVSEANRASDKDGTPTMGGVFWSAAVLLATLLFANPNELLVVNGAVLLVGMGVIGFIDDYIKWKRDGGRTGLSRMAKLLPSLLVAGYVMVMLWMLGEETGRPQIGRIYFPLLEDLYADPAQLGMWGLVLFVVFESFVVLACSHAVNVTDGLDGLAAGAALPAFGALILALYGVALPGVAEYLNLPEIRGAGELAVMGGGVLGATLGFLWFNTHPAQIFMGDSGSLPMGALLAYFAIVAKQELILPFIALVFVIEVGSSFIQIAGFKLTRIFTGKGRRLLPIAPIHHYFRRTLPEQKVVVRFWLVAAVGAAASLLMVKVR